MLPIEMSETEKTLSDGHDVRSILERFARSKILEVYFSRLDGRTPEVIPVEYEDLYKIELSAIKAFLLGKHPQDTILQKVFRIMN